MEARKERIAVLTNSSLLAKKDVQKNLMSADFVVVKLDAPSQIIFEKINRPLATIEFNAVLQAIKDFRHMVKGKLALQIMFIEDNRGCASKIAQIVKKINPDEV